MIHYVVYALDVSGKYYEAVGVIYLKMDGKDGSFSATNKTVKKLCDGLKVNTEARFLKLHDGMPMPKEQIGKKEMRELDKQTGLCFSYNPHERSLSYV